MFRAFTKVKRYANELTCIAVALVGTGFLVGMVEGVEAGSAPGQTAQRQQVMLLANGSLLGQVNNSGTPTVEVLIMGSGWWRSVQLGATLAIDKNTAPWTLDVVLPPSAGTTTEEVCEETKVGLDRAIVALRYAAVGLAAKVWLRGRRVPPSKFTVVDHAVILNVDVPASAGDEAVVEYRRSLP